MPSATRAHNSDSIAPNSASVRAGLKSNCTVSQPTAGHCSVGRLVGMPPKRLPMVSTGQCPSATPVVASTNTTIEPGTSARRVSAGCRRPSAGRANCHSTSRPRQAKANKVAVPLKLGRAACSVASMPKKSAGILLVRRPKKSLICDNAISTAMPLVKPITTATGMKRTRVPSLNRPIANSITPDMAVAMIRLARPYRSTMPYTMTMNAPAGPPICTRLPPSAEIRKPAMMAVNSPASGLTPLAIAKAMANGSATTPTVTPAPMSRSRRWRL